MKKITLFSFLSFLFFQVSFSQGVAEKKYTEAVEQYRKNDFDSANLLIKELKPLYKSVPPKVIYLEIMTKSSIIKKNPLNDFTIISETRNLISKYLKDNVAHKNNNYATIKSVSVELNSYPKDQTSFLALKQQMEQEEIVKKEAIVIAAAAAKAQEEEMAIIRENKRKSDSIKNEEAKIEAEKNRIANAEATAKNDKIERENEIKAEEVRKKQEKKYNHKLSSFSSLGFQSGEIAKYGLLYERGGKKFIGFHISARTSLTSEEDILNGKVIENKTELELGPNFKIFKRLYFNIGIGYGYYDRIINNDYAGTLSVEKTGYLLATSGLMIRISRVININSGVSFMDVDKAFYKPEITFGISFNHKKKYSY